MFRRMKRTSRTKRNSWGRGRDVVLFVAFSQKVASWVFKWIIRQGGGNWEKVLNKNREIREISSIYLTYMDLLEGGGEIKDPRVTFGKKWMWLREGNEGEKRIGYEEWYWNLRRKGISWDVEDERWELNNWSDWNKEVKGSWRGRFVL